MHDRSKMQKNQGFLHLATAKCKKTCKYNNSGTDAKIPGKKIPGIYSFLNIKKRRKSGP